MNTLSIFPDMLTFGLLAPFILRVVIGLIFIYFGVSKIWLEKERRVKFFKKIGFGAGIVFFWIISVLEIIGGVFLMLGLFTQPTSLVLMLIIIGAIYTKIRHPHLLDNTVEFYFLVLAVLLSLLVLGPGFWGIDLPL
ncbi:MAG TPA: DoxX family protein [Candidatus Yonathbacteria bacterium]|nr:DoxX family protein [Candidatus Yonathbacteria bacterium]